MTSDDPKWIILWLSNQLNLKILRLYLLLRLLKKLSTLTLIQKFSVDKSSHTALTTKLIYLPAQKANKTKTD